MTQYYQGNPIAEEIQKIRREARRAALEEAAKVAESYYHQTRKDVFNGVAFAIRSLIDQ